MASTRRLAAIMFTDIVGYTALSQSDERGARGLVREQERLVRPLLEIHRGRLVKSMGDGLLMEFQNALDAVTCAIDLQRHIHERNVRDPPPDLKVRIGIHVGDVEEEGPDILGDAVNVASRLEPLADPGGIIVSGSVEQSIRGRVSARITKIGARDLKGVQEPIELYAVGLPPLAGDPSPGVPDSNRVAVLPFANISPHPEDAYVADGMTEELTATMSKVGGLSVLARTSVLRYRGGSQGIDEIARELRARYILEGSVRKLGDKIRITAQLIRSEDGVHLWSDSYDGGMSDLFAVQSQIAQTVARTLEVKLLQGEREKLARPFTHNPDAHALYLRGIAANANADWFNNPVESFLQSVRCLGRAVELDPSFSSAYAHLADSYLSLFAVAPEEWPREKSIVPAEAAVARALALDPLLAEGHRSLAAVRYFNDDWHGAEVECRRAIELNPSDPWNHVYLGFTLEKLGRLREANEALYLAVSLAPFDRASNSFYTNVLIRQRRYQETIERMEKVLEFDPGWSWAFHQLGVCYVYTKNFDRGIEMFQRILEKDRSDHALGDMAWAYAAGGRTKEAEEVLQRLVTASKTRRVPGSHLVYALTALGRTDEALAVFEQEFEEGRTHSLDELRDAEAFDGIREHPRSASLLAKYRERIEAAPKAGGPSAASR